LTPISRGCFGTIRGQACLRRYSGRAGTTRKTRSTPDRLRGKGESAPRQRTVTESVRASSRLRHSLFCSGTFLFAPNDGIQFSAEEQKQTGKIHPGQKNND